MSDKRISKHSLFRLKITVGCPLCTYPSIHFSLDEDTLKITVGCLTSAYPSIHVETLRITVGCPLRTYPSIHVETLRITVGCLWSTYPSIRNKNLHTCGLWAQPRWIELTLLVVQELEQDDDKVITPRPETQHCGHKQKQKRKFGQKGRLTKKKGPFHYRNISGEEFIFYYSFK